MSGALFLTAFLWASSGEAVQDPAILYRCRHRIANPGGHSGALTLDKTFREDGSVQEFTVLLEDSGGSFIRPRSPDGRAIATLRWPGDHLIRLGTAPFSWSEGSIDVSFHAQSPNRYQYLPKERWRQVVVDRNRSVMVHEAEGMRTLFLSALDMRLVSELEPVSSPGRLKMSLDGIIAWGSGAGVVTVYETLVRPRPYGKHVYPNSPVGRMRVVGEYDVDVPALQRKVDEVREAARAWEAGLGDFKVKCEREVEESDTDIIVT